MPQAVFEPTITANELQQTHDLDRVASGIGNKNIAHLMYLMLGMIVRFYSKLELIGDEQL